MRAVQIVDLSGPDSALALGEVPEPASPPEHLLTPGSGVLVEVHAAGVSFPEVLQTRGEYQLKPPLPFVPGSEIAGIVREAPADAAVECGRSRRGVLRARGVRRAGGRARVPDVPALRPSWTSPRARG